MTEDQIGALIAVNGLLSQLAGAVLLVGLFTALLRSHPRPQPYFRQWTLGWVALVVALCGVAVQYALPDLLAREPLAARAANLVYQAAKLLYVACLLAGTLNFVHGSRSRTFMRWTIRASVAYALTTTVIAGASLNAVMVFQMPLLVAAFVVCGSLLLRLSRSRATLGSRTTGVVFVAIAALWILYVVGFALEGFQPWGRAHGFFHFLLQYNSFFDLILQMLLGYGMVVLLLEDVSREREDARYQLALAHDRLKQLSFYDALTGALNRRAYDEGAGLEALGGRFGTALMVDMDNLRPSTTRAATRPATNCCAVWWRHSATAFGPSIASIAGAVTSSFCSFRRRSPRMCCRGSVKRSGRCRSCR
jgi:uncharacterized membrane protein YhdT